MVMQPPPCSGRSRAYEVEPGVGGDEGEGGERERERERERETRGSTRALAYTLCRTNRGCGGGVWD